MNVKTFEEKYRNKGGMAKLTELRSLFFSQNYIANHFNVSKERVRHWMLDFFGSNYDGREDRADAITKGMKEFYLQNGLKEFRKAFSGTQYYKNVLKEIKK